MRIRYQPLSVKFPLPSIRTAFVMLGGYYFSGALSIISGISGKGFDHARLNVVDVEVGNIEFLNRFPDHATVAEKLVQT